MKVPTWMRILDVLWGALCLLALGAALSGRVPWYKAALPLAPLSLHLVFRSRSFHRPEAQATPKGAPGARGATPR